MIFLGHLSRFVRWLFLISVLLLAVVLSAARLLLPEISQYRAEIVSSISESIGKPIEMDSMAAGLDGIRPEVVLNGVKVIDPRDRSVLLRFEQLRAGLNVREFFSSGRFQPRRVTIRGAKLSIRRNLEGSFSVVGLDSGEEIPKWIFEDGLFELRDSELDWQDLKHPAAALHLSGADVRLLNRDLRHQVAIDVDLPRSYGKSLSIRMDFQGNLFEQACCTGRIYVHARDVLYGKLLDGVAVDGYRIFRGRGGFRVWGNWERSVLVKLQGELDLHDGSLLHEVVDGTTSGLFDFVKIGGEFQWLRQQHGWNLSVRRLAVNQAGVAWPTAEFALKRIIGEGFGPSSLYFNSSYLRLEDLRQMLVDLKSLPRADQDLFTEIAPSGEIFDLRLGYSLVSDDEPVGFACARFENIGFTARESHPGAKKLSGNVCGTHDHGRIRLLSERVEIDLPQIFRNPIDLATLKGDLRWQRGDRFWTILGSGIETDNPLLSATSRLNLKVPRDGGAPFLDLQAAFSDVDAEAVRRYLPVGVLKRPLVEWLDSAIVSGTVPEGGVLFRGSVTAFPFTGAEGVFEALFKTKDVVLVYHPDWPAVASGEAELRFFQAGMEIRGEHAQISGIDLRDVRAWSDDFDLDDYLTITGRSEGSLSQSIKFLRNTPLGPLYEPLLEFVSIRGDNRIDLDLRVPITTGIDDVLVKGGLALKNARVKVFGLELNRIYGNLEFTRERIYGKGLRGMLLDSPVNAELSDNKRGLAVHLEGAIGAEALANRYPSEFWKWVKGESDYAIDLQIPKLSEKLYADIDLRSDLKGLSVDLPEPLQKPAGIPRVFRLITHLEPGSDVPVDLEYGEVARAEFTLDDTNEGFDLKQGRIGLGNVPAAGRTGRGLGIDAALDDLELAPWKALYGSIDASARPDAAILNRIDLKIGKLTMDGADFGPFTLKMQRKHGVWEGHTHGEIASGRFKAENNAEKEPGLNLTFDYLKIPEQKVRKDNEAQRKFNWNPASIVDLNLRSEHFFWKQVDYGSLELITTRQSNGMRIDRLNIIRDGFDLNLYGDWVASGNEHRTSISGNMTIDDLGQFLKRMGKANVIRDSNVKSSVRLNWNDPLFDLNSETLSGNVWIDFGQGRLLTVEPGLGRVFGLFNLDGLKNLLLFDFGKLFGKGLAFEEVKSAFLLTDGRARITRLTVDAVPAEIRVAGEIDLVAERFDDIVTVVPKGVVAAGASMLLTQELPRSAVDGLINRQYQVTGKWDNPEIIRLPGSGKPL